MQWSFSTLLSPPFIFLLTLVYVIGTLFLRWRPYVADWLDYLSRYNAIRNWLTSLHLLSFKKITSAHCANAFNMNRTLCCHYMWNLRHIGAVQILFKSILGFIGLIIESKLPCFMAHRVVLAQVIRCVYTCRANVLCIRRDTRTPATLQWNPGQNNATVAAGAIELQAV